MEKFYPSLHRDRVTTCQAAEPRCAKTAIAEEGPLLPLAGTAFITLPESSVS